MRLGGADQIAAMLLLRLAHVIEQADEIAHGQEAQLFREIALERAQIAAEENALQRRDRIRRALRARRPAGAPQSGGGCLQIAGTRVDRRRCE